MKKILTIIILVSLAIVNRSNAQDPGVQIYQLWNGATSNSTNGTANLTIQFGNFGAGDLLISGSPASPMILTITFLRLSNITATETNTSSANSIGIGNLSNYFSVSVAPGTTTTTYTYTQIATIPASVKTEVTYSGKITATSLQQYGANMNITPGAYAQGLSSNTTGNDNASAYVTPTTVLPIALKSFDANAVGCNGVNLNWTAATELNAKNYEIEYSSDGVNFITIGILAIKGNNYPYTFNYQVVKSGKAYFRLKFNDQNGTFSYSGVQVLNISCGTSTASIVYPNPAREYINISTNLLANTNVIGNLYNSTGQLVLRQKLQNGTNQIEVNNLSTGLYALKLIYDNGNSETFKVQIR